MEALAAAPDDGALYLACVEAQLGELYIDAPPYRVYAAAEVLPDRVPAPSASSTGTTGGGVGAGPASLEAR